MTVGNNVDIVSGGRGRRVRTKKGKTPTSRTLRGEGGHSKVELQAKGSLDWTLSTTVLTGILSLRLLR